MENDEKRIVRLLNEARKCGVDDPGLSDVLMDYFCGNDDSDDGECCLNVESVTLSWTSDR